MSPVRKTAPVETGFAPKLHRPATYDHLRKKDPVEQTVDIVLSQAAFDDLAEIERQVGLVSEEDTTKKAKLTKELGVAKKALDDATVQMKFRSIGRKAYDQLVKDHPATDEQRELRGEDAIWNEETFPIAIVAASCVEPVMTYEEVEALFDEWTTNETIQLFFAALGVNTGRRTITE